MRKLRNALDELLPDRSSGSVGNPEKAASPSGGAAFSPGGRSYGRRHINRTKLRLRAAARGCRFEPQQHAIRIVGSSQPAFSQDVDVALRTLPNIAEAHAQFLQH